MVHKQTESLYWSEKQRATEILPYSPSLSFLFSFISPPLLSSLLKSKTTAFAWISWCVLFVCVFTPMLSLVVAGNQKGTKPSPYPFDFDTHAVHFYLVFSPRSLSLGGAEKQHYWRNMSGMKSTIYITTTKTRTRWALEKIHLLDRRLFLKTLSFLQ